MNVGRKNLSHGNIGKTQSCARIYSGKLVSRLFVRPVRYRRRKSLLGPSFPPSFSPVRHPHHFCHLISSCSLCPDSITNCSTMASSNSNDAEMKDQNLTSADYYFDSYSHFGIHEVCSFLCSIICKQNAYELVNSKVQHK